MTEQLLRNHADITFPKRLIKHLLLHSSPIPASLKASKFILPAQRHFRSLWQRTERQGQERYAGSFLPDVTTLVQGEMMQGWILGTGNPLGHELAKSVLK